MNWTLLDTWIVVAGALSAMSCALLGNFLVLRRMSMMGDAISHAVLPGLAIAFLLTGSRASLTMFLGAAVVGVLTALFIEWIRRLGRVEESAAMGVVFTALFAVGLVLIVRAADSVDLDPGCVLYGAIELIPLDTQSILGWDVPRAVVVLAGILLVNLIFTLMFYKELRITAFDPALATTLGFSARLMHYLLMIVVAATTVASFESVGSILVIAMLIVPASAAHLLTDRYGAMLVVSVLIALASAIVGHLSAITVPTWIGFADTSTSGMMAVTVGAFFATALLFAPRQGVVSRVGHRLALSLRIIREDILGLLWRLEESGGTQAARLAPQMLREALPCSDWMRRLAMMGLRHSGEVAVTQGAWRLTPIGRTSASRLVRAHRLWESYLAKHLGLPADHVHRPAERVEHFLTSSMDEAIARDLRGPALDPHGRPIPGGGSESREEGPEAETTHTKEEPR